MDPVQFDNFMQQLQSVVFSDDKLRLLGTCVHNIYDGPQAVAVANVFANSDDKKKAVAIMNFRLLSITCEEAAEIIRSASFVDDKFAILERLIPKLTDRDGAGEQEIVDAFPFANDKSKAQKVFAAVPASACQPFNSGAFTNMPPPGGDMYPAPPGSPPGMYSPSYPASGLNYPAMMSMTQLPGAFPMTSLYGGGMYQATATPSPYSGYALTQTTPMYAQAPYMNPSMAPSTMTYPYYPGNV